MIKIERPGKGDDSRAYGPPFARDAAGQPTSEAAYFLAANRGKQSVAVDIATAQGQQLVRELSRSCDVLIENYKVGDLARYHLAYEDLQPLNPGLIYCSVTGFGQTGPWRSRPGYDFMVQGISGLMDVTGAPDQVPGGGPVRVGVPVIDIMTGMYAAIAICAALAGRAATGRGQRLDVALLDTALALLAVPAMGYLASGSPPQRIGNSHPTIVPYGVFPTRDGQLVLACGNDNLFRRFCEAAGRPELAGHPSFRSNSDRVCHRTELEAQLRGLMGAAPTSHWVAVLEKAGVPCAPILSVAQALQLPQVAHRRVVQDLVHPLAGTVPNIASPMRFSGMPVVHDRPAPTLGQHTRTVLREQLNLSDGELQTLADAGVI